MVVYRLEISRPAMIQSPRLLCASRSLGNRERWKKKDLFLLRLPPSPGGDLLAIRENTSHLATTSTDASCVNSLVDRYGRQTDSLSRLRGKLECHPANEINGRTSSRAKQLSVGRAARLNATTL